MSDAANPRTIDLDQWRQGWGEFRRENGRSARGADWPIRRGFGCCRMRRNTGTDTLAAGTPKVKHAMNAIDDSDGVVKLFPDEYFPPNGCRSKVTITECTTLFEYEVERGVGLIRFSSVLATRTCREELGDRLVAKYAAVASGAYEVVSSEWVRTTDPGRAAVPRTTPFRVRHFLIALADFGVLEVLADDAEFLGFRAGDVELPHEMDRP